MAAGLAAWAAAVVPDSAIWAVTTVLGWTLLALSWIDLRSFRLPDLLTLPLTAAGLVVSALLPDTHWIDHGIGVVAGYGLMAGTGWAFRQLRGRDGLGLGDAKLVAAAGAWLGWQGLPGMILLACLVAAAWLTVLTLARGRRVLVQAHPFGPALCAAFWLVWLYGPPMVPAG